MVDLECGDQFIRHLFQRLDLVRGGNVQPAECLIGIIQDLRYQAEQDTQFLLRDIGEVDLSLGKILRGLCDLRRFVSYPLKF